MAGSVAFPRYTGKEGAASLSMRLIREADTLMLPGSLFGFSDSHFRVGLGRKAYHEALSRLLRTART
jgi:aspartate/methionine/tyrosine aminotransferase